MLGDCHTQDAHGLMGTEVIVKTEATLIHLSVKTVSWRGEMARVSAAHAEQL